MFAAEECKIRMVQKVLMGLNSLVMVAANRNWRGNRKEPWSVEVVVAVMITVPSV